MTETPPPGSVRRLKMSLSGADWVESGMRLRKEDRQLPMSELGIRVAEALGYAFFGIYHIGHAALFHKRVHWADPYRLEIVIRDPLSTRDSSYLSRLIAACASLGLRLQIGAAARGYLQLVFVRMGEKYGGMPPYVDSFPLPDVPQRLIEDPSAEASADRSEV